MSTYHENAGKGDNRRPSEVSKETYSDNWDAIFSKKQLSKEQKLEVFDKYKAENYVASMQLSGLVKPFCTTCGNTRVVYDAGFEYECQVCKEK